MGLLNYTTEVSAEKSVGEIQQMLARARAAAIMCEYDGAGNVVAISFKTATPFGLMSFRLPADPKPVIQILNDQASAGKIPRRYKNDVDQARRVVWRIVKDWIEAQLALIETRMVRVEQVFLPYAQNAQGQTLFEILSNEKFRTLALEAAKR